MPDTVFLFVYGTLMHSSKNEMADFLKLHSKLYAEGYFKGALYDLGEYPGAVASENRKDKVWGQVFELNPAAGVFSLLDEYEGISDRFPKPHLYERKKVHVTTVNKEIVDCWVYLYNLPVKNQVKIESGNYIDFLRKK